MRICFFLSFFLIIQTSFSQDNKSDDSNMSFEVIENVPVYPGCTGDSNRDLKKCMTDNISKFVGNNFNLDITDNLKLTEGIQRISVIFKINAEGNVVDVTAEGPHPKLEEEAIRVVALLPKFIPGKHKGESVGVLYALPILFKYEAAELTKKQKRMLRKKGKN